VPGLIEHLESRLGRVRRGTNLGLDGAEQPFQVAELSGGGQLEGSTSYATMGLSALALSHPDSARPLRMELIMSTHSAQSPGRLPQSLMLVAGQLSRDHLAILKGETIPLPGPITDGSRLSFLYAMHPAYFDEEFDALALGRGRAAAIVWLVPIAASEKSFIAARGWSSFDDQIARFDPDLLDLFRQPIC
jgi:hypothetical protein